MKLGMIVSSPPVHTILFLSFVSNLSPFTNAFPLSFATTTTSSSSLNTWIPKNQVESRYISHFHAKHTPQTTIATSGSTHAQIRSCRYVSDMVETESEQAELYLDEEGDDEDIDFMSYVSDAIDAIEQTPLGELDSKWVDTLSEILFGEMEEIFDSDSDETHSMLGNGALEDLDDDAGMELAEWFIWRILDEKEEGNSKVNLPIQVYNMIIQKYLALDVSDGFEKAKTILNKMKNLSQTNQDPNIQPNSQSFNLLLSYMAKPNISKQKDTDNEAWELFETAERLLYSKKSNQSGMMQSYVHLIDIVAQSRNKGASYRAEDLLREGMSLFLENPTKNPISSSPETQIFNTRSFNVVLTSIAKTNEEQSPERASELLAWMSELSNTYPQFKPNVYSFTAVIDAFAQRNQYDYTRRAEGIWSQMLSFYLSGESDIEPDVFCSTIVITSYARLAKKGSRDAAKKAEKILKRMEDLYRDGKTKVKPDAVAYFTVLNAWAYTKQEEAAENAQRILLKMEHLSNEGDETMAPSHITYRMIIEAWSKNYSPEAMENAEIIFDRIRDRFLEKGDYENDELKQTYRIMISGWAQKKNAEKAEYYLRDIIERGVCPESYCFDRVIDCWSQSDDENFLEKATSIFDLAEKYIASGELDPNERLFTSVIRMIAKSDTKEKASKAQAILYKMTKLDEDENINDVKPSVFSYNAVLFACCNTDDLPYDHPEVTKAFEIAIVTFNELRNAKMQPDHITYGSLFKVASLLPMGDKRNKIILATFKKCIQDGFLNEFVLGELKLAAQPELLDKLIGGSDVEIDELPYEWSKNGSKKRKQDGQRGRFR